MDLIDAVTYPPPLYSLAEGKGLKVKDAEVETTLYLELKEVFYGAVKKMKILRTEFADETQTCTEVKERILVVSIAPGILPGTRFRFPEEGDQGPTRFPADLVFVVQDKQHNVYTRDGAHLHMTYPIDLHRALCGFVVTLYTLDDRTLNVPITDVVQ